MPPNKKIASLIVGKPASQAGSPDSSSTVEVFPLFINQTYFIEVTRDGYCHSSVSVYEGAMGVIIQVRSEEGQPMALKLPRLMADTPRENSFINRVMQHERDMVHRVSAVAKGMMAELSLLSCETGSRGVLEHQLLFGSSLGGKQAERVEQNGGFVLVQFNKGRPPRLLNIKRTEDGEIHIYPPAGSGSDPEPWRKEVIEVLARKWTEILGNRTSHNGLPSTYVLSTRTSTTGGDITPLDDEFRRAESEARWYAFLPSLLFPWCSTSFQQDIQESPSFAGWKLSDRLGFVRNITNAVEFLHKRHDALGKPACIHGDVRPANILYGAVGSVDAERRYAGYSLIDFGGHAPTDGQTAGMPASVAVSHGPTVVPTRYSIFYAEERGLAEEKEFGDTALWKAGKSHHLLLVGWRTSGVQAWKDRLADIEKEFVKTDANLSGEPASAPGAVLWPAPGDRVRIRDYVFAIRKSHQLSLSAQPGTLAIHGVVQVFLCEPTYFKVLHNSISVPVDDASEWPANATALRELSISRVTQMMQVGPAADLYSLGILLLYSLFWAGARPQRASRSGAEGETGEGGGESALLSPEERQRVEARFKEVIQVMAGRAWMDYFWNTLDGICSDLETLCLDSSSPESKSDDAPQLKASFDREKKNLKNQSKEEYGASSNPGAALGAGPGSGQSSPRRTGRGGPGGRSSQSDRSGGEDWKSCKDQLQETVETILTNLPGTEEIYSAVNRNPEILILVLHYALCCLHRKDIISAMMKDAESKTPAGPTLSRYQEPFCQNRLLNEPENWQAASRALKRLDRIISYVRGGTFQRSNATAVKTDSNLVGATFELRRRLKQETEALAATQENLRKANKLVEELQSMQREKEHAEAAFKQAFIRMEALAKACSDLEIKPARFGSGYKIEGDSADQFKACLGEVQDHVQKKDVRELADKVTPGLVPAADHQRSVAE